MILMQYLPAILIFHLLFLSVANARSPQQVIEITQATVLPSVQGCYPSVDSTANLGVVLAASDGTFVTVYNWDWTNSTLVTRANVNVTQWLSQSRPQTSVKVLDTQRFMVVWIEEEISGQYYVMGRICDRSYGCSGSNFQISSSGSDPYSPRLTVIGDTGTIMIAWTEPNGTNQFKISYRMYNTQGNPQTATKSLGTPLVLGPSYYDIGSLYINSNWGAMIIYSDVTKAAGVSASLVTPGGVVESSFEISNSTTFSTTRLAVSPGLAGTWAVVGEQNASVLAFAGNGTSINNSSTVVQAFYGNRLFGEGDRLYVAPAIAPVGDPTTYVTAMTQEDGDGDPSLLVVRPLKDATSISNSDKLTVVTDSAQFAAIAGIPQDKKKFVVSYCKLINTTNYIVTMISNYACMANACPVPFPVSPSPSASVVPPSPSAIPSASSTPSKVSKNNSDTSVIAGVSAGVGSLFLGASAFLVWTLTRKNKKDKKVEEENENAEGPNYEITSDGNSKPKVQYQTKSEITQPKNYSLMQLEEGWKIPYSQVSVKEELGRGAFGVVYRCVWRGTDCVVKVLNSEVADSVTKISFVKEANAMRKLGNHPNLVLLLGVCDDPMAIFMEFVEGGSLWHCLEKKKIKMITKLAIKFAKDIATGMSQLHSENIIHMDLACRNLLVVPSKDGNHSLKITDFGLSRVLDPYKEMYVASDTAVFPIRWTAIETLNMRIITKASDVWSFGITLWELMEAKFPYPNSTNVQVMDGLANGVRPTRPTAITIPDSLWNLMERCWRETPSERPPFNEICNELEAIEKDYLSDQ